MSTEDERRRLAQMTIDLTDKMEREFGKRMDNLLSSPRFKADHFDSEEFWYAVRMVTATVFMQAREMFQEWGVTTLDPDDAAVQMHTMPREQAFWIYSSQFNSMVAALTAWYAAGEARVEMQDLDEEAKEFFS